jgi:protein-disulfide isomerase
MTPLLFSAMTACAGSEPDPGPAGTPTSGNTAPPAVADTFAAMHARADLGRILGDSAAPLWMIMVSDFQCPYCKQWHDQTFEAIKKEFVEPGRVRLAYLHLPGSGHQHARRTAELSMCASAQGRFWEMHDALFDSQAAWSRLPSQTTFFDSLALSTGVDQQAITACMDARAMEPLVNADYQRAVEAGVGATPTFLIGATERVEGAESIQAFRAAVARAERARLAPAGGK